MKSIYLAPSEEQSLKQDYSLLSQDSCSCHGLDTLLRISLSKKQVVCLHFGADIVGFTNISSSLPPAEVMAMLDRLYSAFDALTEKHDLFKVETIGDAYMASFFQH